MVGLFLLVIDDNEFTHLKLISMKFLDLVNRITSISVINNPKGRSDEKDIATPTNILSFIKEIR